MRRSVRCPCHSNGSISSPTNRGSARCGRDEDVEGVAVSASAVVCAIGPERGRDHLSRRRRGASWWRGRGGRRCAVSSYIHFAILVISKPVLFVVLPGYRLKAAC